MRGMIAIGLAVLGVGVVGSLQAQQPAGELEISGTSTVRPWTCKETDIETEVKAPAGFAAQILAGEKAVDGVALSFPVEKIDCGNGKMNEHMRKALKEEKYDAIRFELSTYEIGQAVAAGQVPVKVVGQMTIAGTTKPMTMDVTVEKSANGGLEVKGSQSLLMTEFGVKPPTLMLGTLKVGDEVAVKFDVTLSPSTVALLRLPETR